MPSQTRGYNTGDFEDFRGNKEKNRLADEEREFVAKRMGKVTIEVYLDTLEDAMDLVASVHAATGEGATREAGEAVLHLLSLAELNSVTAKKR